ncbi:hypothetical protein [Rhodospirillum sp. A1_3_36]|uniref:hypothetical protein n=1 Tax=Rhodospirillum sp. A1_3_36 TaxID=3391666 RepID=UPI0039A5BB24
MNEVTKITIPELYKMWQKVKKDAQGAAKKKKKEDAFTELMKEFGSRLETLLKEFAESYPNSGKMKEKRNKSLDEIKKYKKKIVDYSKSKKLEKDVLVILDDGLRDIEYKMDASLSLVQSAVESGGDVAMKQAIKASKKTKFSPLILFQHDDLSDVVMKMKPKAKTVFEIEKLEIEAILDDEKILQKIGDGDPYIAQKCKDAGNFKQLVTDIANAYEKAANSIAKDPTSADKAKQVFSDEVTRATQNACERAAGELNRLEGVRVNYRNYKIESRVKLGATVAGTGIGVASLALSPFTGGASVVAVIGVAKGLRSTFDQTKDLRSEAEQVANRISENLYHLNSQYENLSRNNIGADQVLRTTINALLPGSLNTIKGLSKDCDLLDKKIEGLEMAARNTSRKLDTLLKLPKALDNENEKWTKRNEGKIWGRLRTSLNALKKKNQNTPNDVKEIIERIMEYNSRVEKARKEHGVLAKQVKILSDQEPTGAKFAEVFVELSASVAFLAVGWKGAVGLEEAADKALNYSGNLIATLEGVEAACNNVQEELDNQRR